MSDPERPPIAPVPPPYRSPDKWIFLAASIGALAAVIHLQHSCRSKRTPPPPASQGTALLHTCDKECATASSTKTERESCMRLCTHGTP